MIKLALKRPVLTIVVFLAITFTGVLSFKELSLSLFPSFDFPELTVVTHYPGATPLEVEEYVTRNIEQAVSGVTGVKSVSSTSKENLSVIRVQFDWGTNMEYATLNLREKLDSARMMQGFPEDAARPTILKWNPASSPIMGIFVSSNESIADLTEFLETAIKQRIEGIDGVSALHLKGSLKKEVVISYDSKRLAFFKLTPAAVSAAIKDYNQETTGGIIKKSNYRYSLRIVSSLRTIVEIENIPVKKAGYDTVLLKDIANVSWGSPDTTAISRMNGKTGVLLLVYKTVSSNTLSTIEEVKTAITQLKGDFPGYDFSIAFENSKLIKVAISNVIQTIIFGGLLAFLVIILFLGNFKAPVIISVSIPVSIVATFALMFFKGVNLNIMSLSGLALGVGMLVDNSIVVIESIFKFKEKGVSDPELKGTIDVAGAVFASTLTTVSVFFPLIFVHGVAGNIFKDQSLTVSFSLLCSYFVSITLLPVVAGMVFRDKEKEKSEKFSFPKVKLKRFLILFPYYLVVYTFYGLLFLLQKLSIAFGLLFALLFKTVISIFTPFMKVFGKAYDKVFKIYHSLLEKSLDAKPLVLTLAFVFLTLGVLSGFFLKKEFFPKTKADYLNFTVALPKNAAISASLEFSGNFDSYLKGIKGVKSVVTVIGVDPGDISSVNEESGTNYLNYNVQITGEEEIIKEKVLRFFKNRKNIFVVFKKAENEFAMLMKTGDLKIKFIASKRKDAYLLAKKAEKLLLKNKSVIEITDNFSKTGSEGIKIVFKNSELLKYGVSGASLGNFIQTCIKGKVVSKLKLTDRNFGIRLRLSEKYRETVNQLLNTVYFHSGKYLKLSNLIETKKVIIPERLEREQQNPVAVLSVVTKTGTDSEKFVTKALEDIEKLKGQESVVVEEGREMQEMRKSLKSLVYALILSFVLVYLLLSAQFESFLLPFVIIFTFPMGLSGAFVSLTILGMSLNVLSFVGLVILSGIVVNDAIVKVDCIHNKVNGKMPLRKAVLEASAERFRPIWMTTVTTILGMAPVFFIAGAGSDLLKPLAVVLIGGLLMATTLTLFLIPAVYEIMYRNKGEIFTTENTERE